MTEETRKGFRRILKWIVDATKRPKSNGAEKSLSEEARKGIRWIPFGF